MLVNEFDIMFQYEECVMKQKEVDVLNLFREQNIRLSGAEIKDALGVKDPSGTIRDLVYFEYLTKNDDGTFSRSQKVYSESVRKTEKYVENHKIVLNKIFTGSFLSHNLGHELINFLKDSNNQRYVYLNPWGERGDKAAETTRYAFHIIESSLRNEKGIYELVAVSEIDRTAEVCYDENRENEKRNSPVYAGHSFVDIFYCGADSDKAHVYTYKASRFLKPIDGLRIFIKVDRSQASIIMNAQRNALTITLMCNPQHSICYADSTGKVTYNSQRNELTDLDVLYQLINLDNGYLVESFENVEIDDLDDEQCFAVISDRTKLEDSTSNQISYFLERDSNLIYVFLHDFLGIQTVTREEEFAIVREKEKSIDLLFVSDNHVVVVENKIDSDINGVSQILNSNGKKNSQLSKYYNHITTSANYSTIPNKHFFVLAPEYNTITQEELDNDYECGSEYKLKSYNELFDSIKDVPYRPLGQDASELGRFLYEQFLKGIEYISWSKAKQHERTAYIRLKQRIKELDR